MRMTALALFAALAGGAVSPAGATAPANGPERILKASPVADRLDPVFHSMAVSEDMQAQRLDPVEIADETIASPHARVIIIYRTHRR